MIKNVFCRHCHFIASWDVPEGGIKCSCSRCTAIRASGFCSAMHEDAFFAAVAKETRTA